MHEAAKAQVKLHSIIRHTASVVKSRATLREKMFQKATLEGTKSSPLKSALGLERLELKVEEEGREEETISRLDQTVTSSSLRKPASTSSSVKLEAATPKTVSVKSSKEGHLKRRRKKRERGATSLKPSSQPMTSHTVLLGSISQESGGRGGGQDLLSPREWSVLSYPLPEFPTSSQSLLASLQDGVEESKFHKSIYYSKKTVRLNQQAQYQ